jgi:hypothetical protein
MGADGENIRVVDYPLENEAYLYMWLETTAKIMISFPVSQVTGQGFGPWQINMHPGFSTATLSASAAPVSTFKPTKNC